MAVSVHPTAIVDPSAEIADDVEIGPYSVIGPDVRVGAGTRLMQHVSVIERTIIGRENVIWPGAVLGGDPQDKKFYGEDTALIIGDSNIIREGVTMNRGTGLGGSETRIGSNCLIMAFCHVAHDCILGDHVTMANNVLLGGHIVVEDHVGIGGMTALHHYVSVGQYAFVGGASRISKDAPPYLITEGSPARVRAINRVGLKRNGISEDTMHWLKEAQRLLFLDGLRREEARERLAAEGPVPPEGEHLFEFLAASEQGKQGRARQP